MTAIALPTPSTMTVVLCWQLKGTYSASYLGPTYRNQFNTKSIDIETIIFLISNTTSSYLPIKEPELAS